MNNNMSFNIDEECENLAKIINGNAHELKLDFEYTCRVIDCCSKIKFLSKVLNLTIKYPQVELYLKNLLNYFTINKLENIHNNWSILHHMASDPRHISLGAFEIIINYRINVNAKSTEGRTAAHVLLFNQCNKHANSILNLFIKHGIDLNIVNIHGSTVLDLLTFHKRKLNEETQNCIMTLIDFGAITINPERTADTYDFIEYYMSSTIKPAIKNENKI